MSTDTTIAAGRGGTWQGPPPRQPVVGGIGWRVAGAALSILLIAAGVLSAASWLARRTQTQDTVYRGAVSRIVLDVSSGDIGVTTGAEDQIQVHRHLVWTFSKPRLRESRSGDTLRLGFDCPPVEFGVGCGVDYRLAVPPGVAISVGSSSGDIDVRGVTGGVTASTASGDISVSGTRGALALHSASGDVTALGLGSTPVSVRTASGDVALDFAARPDAVTVDTASGDVTIRVPEGAPYRVDTDTGAGDRTIQVARSDAAQSSLTASTGSGDIVIMYADPAIPR